MGRDRAAYMREYRRRRRAEDEADIAALEAVRPEDWINAKPLAQVEAELRVEELEEEVRHLKAELAKRSTEWPGSGLPPQPRPPADPSDGRPQFNTRPFTPVPKVRK